MATFESTHSYSVKEVKCITFKHIPSEKSGFAKVVFLFIRCFSFSLFVELNSNTFVMIIQMAVG